MNVSLPWLNELVKYDLTPQQLADKLSLNSIGVKDVNPDYLELDLTYNRGDLLSLRGVAREVSAITDSPVKFKNEEKFVWDNQNLPQVEIRGHIISKAPVYCVVKIEGLKVEQLNETWVKKLSNSGIRSINNVADITNLIMLEYGQPMHAFDANKVNGIGVDEAIPGNHFVTLDEKNRQLGEGDIVIMGGGEVIGIAGIMGGKNSEVTDTTTAIILEAAIFDPVQIRKTASRLGLHSEASKRFQHGLTKANLLQALDAAIRMYQEIGGKLTAITLTGDLEDKTKTISLTQAKIDSLLGVNIEPKDIESYLTKLGFTLAVKEGSWEVTVPNFRLDINIEEDLIEEVARMYGYDKIDGKPLSGQEPEKLDQTSYNFIYDLKASAKEAGLTEVNTYSFYSTGVLNNLEWNKQNLVKIANPISAETEYLREDIWPNLLEVVAKNIKQGFKDIAIFELGKVYSPQKSGLPNEPYRLSIALYNGSDNPVAELHQIFQNVIPAKAGIQLNKEGRGDYENQYFHPKRMVFLAKKDNPIGGIAEVHKRFTDKFGIEGRVAVLELELENL